MFRGNFNLTNITVFKLWFSTFDINNVQQQHEINLFRFGRGAANTSFTNTSTSNNINIGTNIYNGDVFLEIDILNVVVSRQQYKYNLTYTLDNIGSSTISGNSQTVSGVHNQNLNSPKIRICITDQANESSFGYLNGRFYLEGKDVIAPAEL